MYIALQAIALKECDVYSYKSDLDTDPFGTHLCSCNLLYVARAGRAHILPAGHFLSDCQSCNSWLFIDLSFRSKVL